MPKLVRDLIPSLMKAAGDQGIFYTANEAEYKEKLHQKLLEEVSEFTETQSIEELADILEVVYAIAKFQGISQDQIEKIRRNKKKQRGGFSTRCILK
jgi:predicted house-cleaning noncanonical NTP pyrophosphatase (MazG superfamily)